MSIPASHSIPSHHILSYYAMLCCAMLCCAFDVAMLLMWLWMMVLMVLMMRTSSEGQDARVINRLQSFFSRFPFFAFSPRRRHQNLPSSAGPSVIIGFVLSSSSFFSSLIPLNVTTDRLSALALGRAIDTLGSEPGSGCSCCCCWILIRR